MSISQELSENEKASSVIVAGGLDPSGGAGLAADILAVQAAGAIALPIATALTVQDSSTAYTSYPVETDIIEQQLAAVVDDFRPAFIKLGLAGSAASAEMIAGFVGDYEIKLILDPVTASSSGAILMDMPAKKALAELLVPQSFLITPNASEAESLTGIRVNEKKDALAAAVKLTEMGARNVLITGGHILGESGSGSVDYLYNEGKFLSLESVREDRGEIRGTGCHLASSVAAYLAQGYDLPEAASKAKEYVTNMIRGAARGGQGAAQALREAEGNGLVGN